MSGFKKNKAGMKHTLLYNLKNIIYPEVSFIVDTTTSFKKLFSIFSFRISFLQLFFYPSSNNPLIH